MQAKKPIVIFLLLAIQAVVFFKNDEHLFYDYYWFCDFAPAVFLLFFLFNNVAAIKGFINILFFGQLGYILVVLTKVLTGITLMNFTFTRALTEEFLFMTITIHLSTLIAFWATYQERTTTTALYYSLIILALTYITIVHFVTPTGDDETNFNLIFHSHLLADFPYYTQTWVFLAFIFVVLPTHVFQSVVSRRF